MGDGDDDDAIEGEEEGNGGVGDAEIVGPTVQGTTGGSGDGTGHDALQFTAEDTGRASTGASGRRLLPALALAAKGPWAPPTAAPPYRAPA
jgi:hypothetical protein